MLLVFFSQLFLKSCGVMNCCWHTLLLLFTHSFAACGGHRGTRNTASGSNVMTPTALHILLRWIINPASLTVLYGFICCLAQPPTAGKGRQPLSMHLYSSMKLFTLCVRKQANISEQVNTDSNLKCTFICYWFALVLTVLKVTRDKHVKNIKATLWGARAAGATSLVPQACRGAGWGAGDRRQRTTLL